MVTTEDRLKANEILRKVMGHIHVDGVQVCVELIAKALHDEREG